MQLEYRKMLKKEGISIDTLPLDIVTRINELILDDKMIKPTAGWSSINKVDLGICEAIQDWIKVNPVKKEAVNHPSHYGGADNPYEAIKVIRAWNLGFELGNTVKYISRAGKKDKEGKDNRIEDLKKALWYLQYEINELEKKNGVINNGF